MVETQSNTVISVAVAFAVITFIILSLRIFARAYLVKHVGRDDYLIIIASLLSWAFIAATIRAAELGLGGHYSDVIQRGEPNFVSYLQTVWLSSVFYNACLGFIKISVLALYMRLGDRNLRMLSIIMTCVVAGQATANVLVCILQCQPIEAAYDIRIGEGAKHCIDINAFYLANAAVNIFTDILTYALPVPLVLKLQVPRPQRIGLGVILSLGFVACLASIIRITFIPAMLASSDPTWDIAQPMYWSVIETNIGILASSIPSTKVIAKKYFPRLLGTSRGPTGGPSTGGFQMMGSRGNGNGTGTSGTRGDDGMGGEALGKNSNHFFYAESTRKESIGGAKDPSLHEMVASPGGRSGKKGAGLHRAKSDAQLSDEEALTDVPQGRIGVTTHVQMQFDDQLPIQGRR